ncbi:MAG: ABC transporter substrate-binding protein [Myxococcota bacterium]
MRRVLQVALLLGCAIASAIAAADPRPRVVVVKTVMIEPFDKAESALLRDLQETADVWVVPVRLGSPHEAGRIEALQPEVIVTLGSQATAWAMQALPSKPIVFSMVLDPISSGFVKTLAHPGTRVTGAALDIPPSVEFRALKQLLGARRVAVLYNPEKSGRLVEAGRLEAARQGMELVPLPVPEPEAFEPALRKIDRTFDALWSIPDALVYSKPLSQRILLYTIRRRVPLMGLSEQHVKAGALFALVTSYEENGHQAAERVRRVLAGERPSQIPVGIPKKLEMVFNPRTAQSLQVDLPKIQVARARPVR